MSPEPPVAVRTVAVRTVAGRTEQPSRRGVLGMAAGIGAAGLLSACGGEEPVKSAGGSKQGTSAEESPTSSAASESPAGRALVATADVPVGAGVILEGPKVVVTQPSKGEFKAFRAVCTHQACVLASVKKGAINCACHGSSFSAADGSVRSGPATRALDEIPVTVEGDQVVQT